jgi:hypothetical protein
MSNQEKSIPCKNCIILGICKARIQTTSTPIVGICILKNQCSRLQEYLGYPTIHEVLKWWKGIKKSMEYDNLGIFFYGKDTLKERFKWKHLPILNGE